MQCDKFLFNGPYWHTITSEVVVARWSKQLVTAHVEREEQRSGESVGKMENRDCRVDRESHVFHTVTTTHVLL